MLSQTHLTRRQFMRCSAGTLLAAGLWPGQLFAGDAPAGEDFHFVAVNDLHYFDQHCGPWFEGAIRRIKAHTEKIDFALLVGDLSDQGKPEQLSAIRDILKTLGLPMYTVIGNHDLKQGDSKPYEQAFPKSMNYHFEHRGWQFVGFDSCQGSNFINVAVQRATLSWLDDTLPKLDKKKPTVIFTHFPLGPRVLMRLTNADAVLDRFKDFNLRAIYNGHYHGYTERTVNEVIVTTNRCCSFIKPNVDGSKEKGYFLCHARQGKIERTFVEVEQVERK